MCVSACPYKKVYYNWSTGKSEKCILCFPRLETGQAPACAHSCVGRIRYMGVLLYDADRIPGAALVPDEQLVDAQRATILDPFDPEVLAAARANGIEESWISAAQKSPAYKFVVQWGLALPLHPEYRTMAMMYYMPPLSPVVSVIEEELFKLEVSPTERDFALFDHIEKARLPVQYLASMFAAGNEAPVRYALRKMLAVRTYMRRKTVEGAIDERTLALLSEAGTSVEEAEAIYRLTTLPTLEERFVIPQYHREMAVEAWADPLARKGDTGFGYVQAPARGE
jgi:nitrate reductase beta subunit